MDIIWKMVTAVLISGAVFIASICVDSDDFRASVGTISAVSVLGFIGAIIYCIASGGAA